MKTNGLRGCLWLLGSLWLLGASVAQAQSISPWQMHEGQGPIQFSQCFAQHGDPGEYAWASIPSMNDPGWFNAPSTAVVGLSRPSALCGIPNNCRCWGDYTYFRSTVTIPANYNLTRFEVELQGMDDGTRITIFNSAYPNGVTPPGAYVVLGQTLTQDLRTYARVGEANIIVLTHVDDCCQESNLHAAYIRLNGQAIPVCQPTAEVCDGQDNDCDGRIDEGLSRSCSDACGTGNQTCQGGAWTSCSSTSSRPCGTDVGECQSGLESCQNGQWQGTCQGSIAPTSERCDGKDNDCDGQIDETFSSLGQPCTSGTGDCQRSGTNVCRPDGSGVQCSATPGPPSPEVCDNRDNDCNGQIDEAFPTKGQPCTAGVGICEASGTLICKPDGSGVQCSAAPVAPSQEVCDNRDNDCNGSVDDNLLRPCTTPCGSGVETCVAGVWGSCSAPAPSPEVCDGKDNDCDGQTDNGLKRPCSTICGAGNETCVNGAWVFCDAQKPEAEVCDGKDNDCNGQIDDGIPPQTCQGDCGQGTATCQNGALSGCSGPKPEPEICDGKDNDCNGKIDDNLTRSCKTDCGEGSELCSNGKWQACTAPLPGKEVCDGKDNDCDGKTDNGAACPAEQACDQGQCRLLCRNGECPRGALCVDGICQGDLCKNVTCPASEICLSGRCVDACITVSCPQGHLCKEGRCIDPSSPQEGPPFESPRPDGSASDSSPEGPSSDTPSSETPVPSEKGNDSSPDASGQTDDTSQDGKGSGTGFEASADGGNGRTPGGCLCSQTSSPLPSALFLLFFLLFLGLSRKPLSR